MYKISKKTIIGGAIGNFLETYDFTIWALLAQCLTKALLPSNTNLSSVFILFLVSYFIRPFGSLISGILADQIGRKKVLSISILLMGISTTLVGVIPLYADVGFISMFLLFFFRIIQVVAMGGEYISSVALLIESCDKKERGYCGSWVAMGVNFGILIASLIAAFLIYGIDTQIFPAWAWRIAFLISFITMIIGFWIRRSIPESYEFILENARKEIRPASDIFKELSVCFKSHFIESMSVFILTWCGVSISCLIYIYAPIFMTTVNKLHAYQALFINAASLVIVILLVPLFGKLSDLFGRIKTLLMALFILLIMIFPYFIGIAKDNFYLTLICHIMIGIPCACYFSVTPTLITEIFPLSIRCSVSGFIYSIASCLAGGLTPLLAMYLVSNTIYYSPSFILIISATIGIVMLKLLNQKLSFRQKNTNALLKSDFSLG
jgi:MHS family proline/betaine transporter-like MFS transporter